MQGFERIIEERIAQAQRRGELEVPELAGQPLPVDDDALVPAEQRMALRVLKNAGYVPAEVTQLREVEVLVALASDVQGEEGARQRARRRLEVLLAQLERGGLVAVSRAALLRYQEALLHRLEQGVPEGTPTCGREGPAGST